MRRLQWQGVCAARACADDIQLRISTHVSATARACATVCTCESPMAHARVNVCITGGVRQAQEEALERAIASGDADAIVKAMREHPAHAAIQRKGCEALRSLAAKSAENKILIAQVGGIEALVTAMQGHATDPGVQEIGRASCRERV